MWFISPYLSLPQSPRSVTIRGRATYFQPARRWPPRFIRRFLLRYPRAHFYAVFGILSLGVMGPVFPWFYNYFTLSKDEFIDYRNNYNSQVQLRQKYGHGLVYPSWKSGKGSSE
ncbi:hypothetical protein AB6A40_003840 [Gnathostoma spinigerum]|uniref:Uncharacterized protein n=1 Tax=Gnathostoma spinigerum TaxID=75299 RepID=A0ABD6ED53_9BILA